MKHRKELELLASQLEAGLPQLEELMEYAMKYSFHMGKWWDEGACDTSVCALGFHIAWNRSQLYLDDDNDDETLYPYYKDEEKNIWSGYHAVAKYFDIFVGEAEYIFDPGEYPVDSPGDITPVMVSRRLGKVLKATDTPEQSV